MFEGNCSLFGEDVASRRVEPELRSHLYDLTVSNEYLPRRAPAAARYWRTRSVQRLRETDERDPMGGLSSSFYARRATSRLKKRFRAKTEFTTTRGLRYFFLRLGIDFPKTALAIWLFLFAVETTMVVLYVVHTTLVTRPSWVEYDSHEFSGFFYAQAILSFLSLFQLVCAYSLRVTTLVVVVATSLYHLVVFFTSFGHGLGWLSRIYVPWFLRIWPMRQYCLLILDAVATFTTRNRKLDIVRFVAGPLTMFLCLYFTAACIFHVDQIFMGVEINIGVALYYTMVTVSTVGFGDVTSETKEGMAITLVTIFVFLYVMPNYIIFFRSLILMLKELRKYKGRLNHFLIYGYITPSEAMTILEEILALYPAKTVCFCNSVVSKELQRIERNPRYRLRCTFLKIATLDKNALNRMEAYDACGFIIFPSGTKRSGNDDDVMVSSTFLQRHLPQHPQHLWLHRGFHSRLLKGHPCVIIGQRFNKKILATALLMPGVVPFLVNLVRTAPVPQRIPPANLWTLEQSENWKELYEFGRTHIINTCSVPQCFVHATVREIVLQFFRYNVLVIAVEEGTRRLMRMELTYVVEPEDTIVVLHNAQNNSFARALEDFNRPKSVSYPDSAEPVMDSFAWAPAPPMESMRPSSMKAGSFEGVSPSMGRPQMCNYTFASRGPTNTTGKEMMEQLGTPPSKYHFGGGSEIPLGTGEDAFLFVDQTSCFVQRMHSLHEEVAINAVAPYDLCVMMRCIQAVHRNSSLTLLTLQHYPPDFMEAWECMFGTPLRIIRGQGLTDAHLQFAVQKAMESPNSTLRGMLFHCSQRGTREFGDIPVICAERNNQLQMDYACHHSRHPENIPNINIVVQLEKYTSCVTIKPVHTDPEWRVRGDDFFQYSLAFMTGRCFSNNMLQTMTVHSYRNPAVSHLYEMLLNVRTFDDPFQSEHWPRQIEEASTLFRYSKNSSWHFEKYLDAFRWLISNRSCVPIGVFRLFPPSEGLLNEPRYFITNPPPQMPLLDTDIIYVLDGGGATFPEELF